MEYQGDSQRIIQTALASYQSSAESRISLSLFNQLKELKAW